MAGPSTRPRAIFCGVIGPRRAWWDVPLPPCPHCGGAILWWEAGWVPGVRRCCGPEIPDGSGWHDAAAGCGRIYRVWTWHGRVFMREMVGRRDHLQDLVEGRSGDDS